MDFTVVLAMAGAGSVLFGAYRFSRRKFRTKKCIYCCNEMDKDQTTCPHCQGRQTGATRGIRSGPGGGIRPAHDRGGPGMWSGRSGHGAP